MAPDRFHRMMFRRLTLALVAIAMLTGAAVPACGDGGCCAIGEEASLHRDMPCCDEPTVSSRETVQLLPATPAPHSAAVPVAVLDAPAHTAPPRVRPTFAVASFAHHDPAPPLFLLNAQFLI